MSTAYPQKTLADIGLKAIAQQDCAQALKAAKSQLSEAYEAWKAQYGFEHVVRDTPDWVEMLEDTRAEYQAWTRARADVYNASRRLHRAIVSVSLGRL